MARTKTLHTHEKFTSGQRLCTLGKGARVRRAKPRNHLVDKNIIMAGVLECLAKDDLKGAIEIMKIHMRVRREVQRDATKTKKTHKKSKPKSVAQE